MSGFVSEPSRAEEEHFAGASGHGNESHTQGRRHDRIPTMSKASVTAVTAGNDAPLPDVSASQKMLSAISGSLLTSLLATPLDVVRVRLQSQPQSASFSALRTSSFKTSPGLTKTPDLGVTACCREVFWVNNNAQYCLATTSTSPSTASLNTLSGPSHTSSTSIEACAVEETRQKTFNSTFDGLRKIARNEGIFTLWRGLSPTLVMAIPGNVIYFTGYDYLRGSPSSPIRNHVSDGYAPLAAGAIARVAAAIAVSPIEMFRTRMQATSGGSEGLFANTMGGVKDMVRAQGFTSLWRGLTLTMWRDVPFSGFYWWGYEAFRNSLTDIRERSRGRMVERGVEGGRLRSRSRSQENRSVTFVDSFVAGAASGAIASVVTTPFDVGKTRQQVFVHAQDMDNPSGGKTAKNAARELLPEEQSMPRLLYHIWRTEGTAGLFRGWAARCMKVAPACAIMISSYEVGKKMAQRANDKKGDGKAL